ncbi:MAG TPA: cellulase family glycosylhydrolase, partial [Bacillota bacterium]|nr:cellulase family glycosylhydrolase [Bacillota bacterium]
ERPTAPAPWRFGNGPEFPGATGSLTVAAGHAGKGAHLAYDLSKGGHYVSASLTLPAPLTTPAIGFWVKSPANIIVVLRVTDAASQTLQYSLRRPLENLDPGSWYQQVVPLDSPNGWWGGPNDGQVHFPISSLSILAADPPLPGAVGAIDFDDLTAVSLTTFDLDPATQPLATAPPGSGDVLSRLGVNIHFTTDNRALDAARAAGLSWVRMDLIWSSVEKTRNTYTWSAYDGLLNALQTRGMNALFILDYGNALYTGANNLPPTNTAVIQAFGNFAEAAARHFAGRGVSFEIWNEPNISGFWPPAPDPAQYTVLAQEAIRRLHQGDPAAPVITGGLSSFDFTFADSFLGLGGAIGANAVGIHPYGCTPPELLSDRILLLRTLVAQHLSNAPPVWDTEWGFSSTAFGDGHSAAARQRQAVMVAREFLCAAAVGFPVIIYYDLRDDGTNPADSENNFGLLANDYSDKPAMQALKTLAAVARGRRFSGFIPATSSSLRVLRFDGRTNMVVALWPSAASNQVTVTVPTNTTATDFLGTPLTLLPWTNRLAWTAYETNGPIYFSFPTAWQATNLALPTFTAYTVTNNTFRSWIAADPALGYSILTSTNLVDWTSIQTLPLPPTSFLFTYPATNSRTFYRLQVTP